MKSLKNIFSKSSAAKSPASKPANKSTTRTSVPTFEPLEGRQMMSASMAAVSFNQPELVHVHVGNRFLVEMANVPTTAVYSVGPLGAVYESTGPGNSSNLGGIVTQISAGLDVNGKPEVYGIAPNGTTWVYDNGKWSSLGGDAVQISASVDGTVYAMHPDRTLWMNQGSGWTPLGGQATQISAGVDAMGKPELYATGFPSPAAFVNDGNGWVGLGTNQYKQIAGSVNGTVFGIAEDNTVQVHTSFGWSSLGGQATQIAAGLDASGKPEVFATGLPFTEVFANDGNGWVDLKGSGTNIVASSVGVGVPNCSVAVLGMNGQTFIHGASGFVSMPLPFASQPAVNGNVTSFQNFSNDPLFGPNGPSINDVRQGQAGDCWYVATLAEVAQQDPNLIRNDIHQLSDGTYMVCLDVKGVMVHEHIDGYLPVNSNGSLEYAQLGQGGSTWVAIMEKALCYFRNQNISPSYATINAGWGREALADLGATNIQELSPSIGNAATLFSDVSVELAAGQAVEFATNGVAGPLVNGHMYSVVAVTFSPSSGGEIEVRNPWGFTGPNNDGYLWVNASAVFPQLDEVVTAKV